VEANIPIPLPLVTEEDKSMIHAQGADTLVEWALMIASSKWYKTEGGTSDAG